MRRFVKLSAVLGIAAMLPGCLAIDDVGSRASLVNKSAGRYANDSILLNIIRARNFEPLNFAGFNNFTGHDDFLVALPTANIFPFSAASVSVGGSTIGASFRNDFVVNLLDDPESYKALTNPVEPRYIGLFLRQGYPRELIFTLFAERVRVGGRGAATDFVNLPDEVSFEEANGKLATLIAAGLTVESFQRSAKEVDYALCFDRSLPPPNYSATTIEGFSPACGSSGSSGRRELRGPGGETYRLATRSVYGIYHYLGAILRARTTITNILPRTTGDTALLTVSQDSSGCFSSASHHSETACVPMSANNTKIVFAVLRQLLNVLTKPSAAPATQTVRAIL